MGPNFYRTGVPLLCPSCTLHDPKNNLGSLGNELRLHRFAEWRGFSRWDSPKTTKKLAFLQIVTCGTIVLNCLIPWIERTHGTIKDNCSTMRGFAARKVQNWNLAGGRHLARNTSTKRKRVNYLRQNHSLAIRARTELQGSR